MRLMYLPTLYDLQSMLGKQTYVEFVWMWRDGESEKLSRERLDKWRAKIPQRQANSASIPPFAGSQPPGSEHGDAPSLTIVALSIPQSRADRNVETLDSRSILPVAAEASSAQAVLEYPSRLRTRRNLIRIPS